MKLKSNDLYLLTFFLMSLVYGAFSSSTPDSIGIAEIFIGLCLLVLVGIKAPVTVFDLARNDKGAHNVHIPLYVRMSFLYLLTVPTVYGVVYMQNDIGNWVRDFIPFIYMFLPVLLVRQVSLQPERWLKILLISLCVIGFFFSIRFFIETGFDLSGIGKRLLIADNRDNTMQDPASQFYLGFSTCLGVWLLLKSRKLLGALVLSAALIPWAVMFASIMRGPVVLTAMSILIMLLYWLQARGSKRVAIIPLLLLFVIVGIYGQELLMIVGNGLDLLLQKQENHGLSSRDQEVTAVFSQMNTIPTLLFGMGWGGLVDSPFGGQYRFVHNMLLYFIFKVGLLGLFFFLLYFFWLGNLALGLFRKGVVFFIILVSLLPPLVVAMVLEPMFKSLSFGLVLLLIPLMSMVKDNPKIKGWL